MPKARLIPLLGALLAACGQDPTALSFTAAATHDAAAFLSVAGTGPEDVWLAGAKPGVLASGTLLHLEGGAWTEVPTGQLHDLWWVHAVPGGHVYAAGGGATVLEIDDEVVTRLPTPQFFGNTVFGLWGLADDDLWAVGGFAGRAGFVWRWDGTSWTELALPDNLPRSSTGEIPALFKVWGRSADDVWIVGGLGTVLHWDGRALSVVPTDTTDTLFTVSGDEDEVVIVGGNAQGVLLRGGVDGLLDDAPPAAPLLQGLTIDDDGVVWVAGAAGFGAAKVPGGAWVPVVLGDGPDIGSVHALWSDGAGGIWSAGGDVLTPALDKGVVTSSVPTPAWTPAELPEPDRACPMERVDPMPDGSIARRWNELILDAIRRDIPHPPKHARNLLSTGVAMWDALAAYDSVLDGVISDESVTAASASDVETAISYAAYRMAVQRYRVAVGADTTLDCFDRFMDKLGHDPSDTHTDGDDPIAVGNRIGQATIDHYLADGAREADGYPDTTAWEPSNPVMIVDHVGTNVEDPDVWQQLNLGTAETQNGIVLDTSVQDYLGPQWGNVEAFALTKDPTTGLYGDPGEGCPSVDDAELVDQVVQVIRRTAQLDAYDGVEIDVGPKGMGNNTLGADDGTGYDVNPVTGQPYAANLVPRGDFTRLVAEVWADGPTSETPPGHWVKLGNEVSDRLSPDDLVPYGAGAPVSRLQWDAGMYLSLGAAAHDAAIVAWELKRDSLGPRPITLIRWMAGNGQRTDPSLPSYSEDGLPLIDDLIELITEESSAEGERHHHLRWYVGELAVWSWPGEPGDRAHDDTPLQWMRALDWIPYQRRTFVTPAFPGFVSGHSTFSRSAAEVLARYTGSPWFPGGLHEYVVEPYSFLKFESGPTTQVRLQWASYFDASDQAGQSRLWGGIHIFADDTVGRTNGARTGNAVADKAETYVLGTAR